MSEISHSSSKSVKSRKAPPPPPPEGTGPRTPTSETSTKDTAAIVAELKQKMMEAAAAKDYKKAAKLQQEIQRVQSAARDDGEAASDAKRTKKTAEDRLRERIAELEKQLKDAETSFDFEACAGIQEEIDRLKRPSKGSSSKDASQGSERGAGKASKDDSDSDDRDDDPDSSISKFDDVDAVISDEDYETDEIRPIIGRGGKSGGGKTTRSKQTFWMGDQPLWRHPTFVEAYAGHSMGPSTSNRRAGTPSDQWQAFEAALFFVTECLEEMLERGSELNVPNLWKVHDAIKNAAEMPAPALSSTCPSYAP
eukprot:g1590.t1